MVRVSLFTLLIGLLLSACNNENAVQPNILIIFTDDNGFEYWGKTGGPDLSPNIDAIANEGLYASNAYISASVCTPSRYTLHTGKYASRCQHPKFLESFPDSVTCNITWNTFLDPAAEITLGKLLQDGGYHTGFVGKWHLGWDHSKFDFNEDDDPLDTAVDRQLKAFHEEAKAIVRKAGFDYTASVTPINIDNHPVEAVRYHNLEWFAKGAMDFLEETSHQDKPFFLIVNLTTHHGPCHIPSIEQPVSLTPAGYIEDLDGIMPERQTIFSRIEEKGYNVDFKTAGSVWTDDCVKAILDQLASTGLSDETMVIFTTDHNRFDGKATCYEGGVKIPFFARYPGIIEAGSKMETRFQLTDILPTLLEAGGIPMPDGLEIDGTSIWPQISGESVQEVHDDLFFEFGYSRGVLAGDWKYIAVRFPEELTELMKNGKTDRAFALRGLVTDEPCFKRYPDYFAADQLYNLSSDPDEQDNLAKNPEYAEKLREMQERLWHYTDNFRNPFPKKADPFYETSAYDELAKKAVELTDMDRFYWFRQECY